MKLKALLLVVCGAAGVGASVAFAGDGNGGNRGDNGKACRATLVAGTVAPQTFTLTVVRAHGQGSPAAGSTVTVTIGGSGQTVLATVGACSGGSGTTTTSALTVRSVDLRARPMLQPETTTVKPHHDNDDHHHHRTTTTTATTTTTP